MAIATQLDELPISQVAIPTSAASEAAADDVMTPTPNEGPGTPDGGSSYAHGPASRTLREENLNVIPPTGDGCSRLHRVPVRHDDNYSNALARVKADAGTTKAVKRLLTRVLALGQKQSRYSPDRFETKGPLLLVNSVQGCPASWVIQMEGTSQN